MTAIEVPLEARPPAADDTPGDSENPAPADQGRGPLIRGALILALLLAGAFVAFGSATRGDSSASSQATTPADAVAGLAVATTELVNEVTGTGGATRATGGYVPGTGIVLTVEIDELPGTEIEAWATDIAASAGARIDDMPADEGVVFLLDIARPTRTSRLLRVEPGATSDQATWELRDAPALSTVPVIPEFLPEDGAVVDG